jgi:alanine-synthesizing transaminase
MHFSALAHTIAGSKNPLYVRLEQLKQNGAAIVDLVKGNVNEHGIVFPKGEFDEILRTASEHARVYRPDSFGQLSARYAVADYYDDLRVSPQQVLITPGTSVSYWYSFKLLAEAGDEILTPQPSYPLFDYIAKLCDVRLSHYRLLERRNWTIDLDHLEDQITPRTRAIVLISPHNPTGMVASSEQLTELAAIAARREIAIISDEVFNEFVFEQPTFSRIAATAAPLVITLNGFSKMFALPGFKIGWMVVSGRKDLVERSMAALELISDTFLPVNEIAQFATPEIFRHGQSFLNSYKAWVTDLRKTAIKGLEPSEFLPPQGGFYFTIKLERDEDLAAMELLEESNILVHPGYFYDVDGDHLVMSFINERAVIERAFERIGAKAAT